MNTDTVTSFKQLGLKSALLKVLDEVGYETPSPIQAQTIPLLLEGKDVVGQAQTGTGKTAGFTLPLLQRLSESEAPEGRRPVRALVLTPTRELAAQVGESIRIYGRHMPLRSFWQFPRLAEDNLSMRASRICNHLEEGSR